MFRLSLELFVFLDEVFVSRKVLQALVFYVLWNDIKIVQEDIPHCNVTHQSTIRKYVHPYQSTIQITIQKYDTKYPYQSTIHTKEPYKLSTKLLYKSTTQSTYTKVPSLPGFRAPFCFRVFWKSCQLELPRCGVSPRFVIKTYFNFWCSTENLRTRRLLAFLFNRILLNPRSENVPDN